MNRTYYTIRLTGVLLILFFGLLNFCCDIMNTFDLISNQTCNKIGNLVNGITQILSN